jgi:UTP--glucose-1-phosphate uridylyltransferase
MQEYVFISNIDNLCATVDLDILYHLYCNEIEMCMEVVEPNRTDTDGGYVVAQPDGKISLVEIHEVPLEKRDDFKKKHHMFNTNNIWLNLRSLKRIMDQGDPRDRVIVTVNYFYTSNIPLTVWQMPTCTKTCTNRPNIFQSPDRIVFCMLCL